MGEMRVRIREGSEEGESKCGGMVTKWDKMWVM